MATRDEKNEFSQLIILRMEQHKTDCLDAILSYCEEVGLEVEVAGSLVNDNLKALLEDQFADMNYLEKTSKLPL